jgi:ATP-binding cassette, subfamily B, bacterial PglK
VMPLKARFTNSTISRALEVLEEADRRKLIWIVLIQTAMGFLDLVGVVVIGGLGALSVQGIESQKSGNKVNILLRIFHVQNESLRFQVLILGAAAAIIMILKTIISVFFTRKTYYFLARKSADISRQIISKILNLDLMKIQERSNQQILYIISEGVKNVLVGILATLVNMASDLSTLLILSIGLFLIDPIIALAALMLFTSVGYILFRKLQFRSREIGTESSELTVKSNQKILEVLNSYRETVVRNRQSFYSRQIGLLRYRLGALTAEMSFQPYISKYVIESTSVIGSLALAGFEFGTKNAVHAVAVLAVFMAASSRIAPAALRMQQGLLVVKNSSGSAEGTFKLLDELRDVSATFESDSEPDFEYTGFVADIEVNSLSFRYANSKERTLSKINMTIGQGSMVAIVGPSGAGKTTLVDLILGVLQPESGTIQISGMNPQLVSQKWPGAIAYVPQNTFISQGTIRDNIALGFSTEIVSDERILNSLKIADLEEFVMSLPKKFDSDIGEQGSKLSGGQRQRLGIARALFTSPKLLVLDEATSSLDSQTELNISDAISNLSGSTTVLIVAHRLSTVQKADLVIYIEKGEIKATGTFEEVRNSVPDFDKQAKLMGL